MYIININKLLSQFEIDTVVKKYCPEWKTGTKICCPFHKEKTPSFSISAPQNIATCFGGCGTFNPVNFVKEKEGVEWIEAVEICAKLHNLEIVYDTKLSPDQLALHKKKQNKQLHLLATNKLVAEAYFKNAYSDKVPESVEFKNDNQVRSLLKATIEKFQVCITPDTWDFIQGQKLDQDTLIALDIVKANKKGGFYDVFRSKQLFPIHGRNNNVVGFAGRQLVTDKKYPKYRNSKETAVYKKKELLYGLYPQASIIRQQSCAYISEGYWDVLTLFDYGFKGAIATCGTALNEKQAKLIKKFAPRACYLADNDSKKKENADNDSKKTENAGLKAIRSGLPILLKEQIHVDVVVFPDNEDPDSYMRAVGLKGFEEYIKEHRKDAVLWYVEDAFESSQKTTFDVVSITESIIDILKYVDNENLIDIYCAKITKILDSKISTFRMQLNTAKNELLESTSSDGSYDIGLSNEQSISISRYGIYEMNNQLMCTKSDGDHVSVSNFIVNPLFHLSSNENPKRLFEIINVQGQRRILDTETTNLVSLDKFKNVVESQGNFVFSGNAVQYNRLKRKIYDLMQTCYEVDTLGYHNDGFYTFGNGIYTQENQFVASDKYGVLAFKQKQYFLPAFSDIYKDTDMLYDEEKNFIYKQAAITFKEWAALFCEVHGKHGQIALCFYLGALFRSHIQKHVKFPLLNLFGQPSTGKSLLAENMLCMFSKEAKGFNIHSGTKVGLFNKLMVVKDGLVLFEEYKNSIDHQKVEALKSIYDNLGRERGQKAASKNLTTPIYSAAIVSGQELPTADVALFTRCITLSFSKMEYSQAQITQSDKLKAYRGSLSGITAQLTTLRPLIEEKFLKTYKEQFSELRNHCSAESVSSRMVENNAILLTVHEILKDVLAFPFESIDLFTNCADNLFEQNRQISKENEVSVFWSLIEYLSAARLISEGEDYTVKYGHKTEPSKLLLYINFNKAYPLYREKHSSQYGKQGLNKSSLQHYLKSHHTFECTKKGVRFGKKNTSAFVFDYEKLGLSLIGAPEQKEELSEEEWDQVNKTKAKES